MGLYGLHPGFSSDQVSPAQAKEVICDGCQQPIGESGGAYQRHSETGKIYLVADEGPHRNCYAKLEERLVTHD